MIKMKDNMVRSIGVAGCLSLLLSFGSCARGFYLKSGDSPLDKRLHEYAAYHDLQQVGGIQSTIYDEAEGLVYQVSRSKEGDYVIYPRACSAQGFLRGASATIRQLSDKYDFQTDTDERLEEIADRLPTGKVKVPQGWETKYLDVLSQEKQELWNIYEDLGDMRGAIYQRLPGDVRRADRNATDLVYYGSCIALGSILLLGVYWLMRESQFLSEMKGHKAGITDKVRIDRT